MPTTYYVIHDNTEDELGPPMIWRCQALDADQAEDLFRAKVSPGAEVLWVSQCETEQAAWADYWSAGEPAEANDAA